MRRLSRTRLRLLAAATIALACAGASALAEEFAVVTNRVVYPGEIITLSMVEEVPLVRGNRNLGPIYQQAGLIDGKVARRTILPGRIIPENAVRPAYLVQVGQPVQVIYNDGGLVINATAVPLEAGAAGDVITLRNIDSGRTFSGTVMADGTIRVSAS
jgi:flagella basal body P-ring formation protein FlgA